MFWKFCTFVDLLCCENENWNMLRLDNLVLRSSTLQAGTQLSSFQDFAETKSSKKLRYESRFVLISIWKCNQMEQMDFKIYRSVVM